MQSTGWKRDVLLLLPGLYELRGCEELLCDCSMVSCTAAVYGVRRRGVILLYHQQTPRAAGVVRGLQCFAGQSAALKS